MFLEQLWRRPTIVSFISTHVFDLASTAPESIQKLRVSGVYDDEKTDHILFDYKLKKGISTISSVDTILRKEGLLPVDRAQTSPVKKVLEGRNEL